jgi:hypothetical protein
MPSRAATAIRGYRDSENVTIPIAAAQDRSVGKRPQPVVQDHAPSRVTQGRPSAARPSKRSARLTIDTVDEVNIELVVIAYFGMPTLILNPDEQRILSICIRYGSRPLSREFCFGLQPPGNRHVDQ